MTTSMFLGTVPGAGGSFPMAGVRAKQRKTLVFTTSNIWICPPNVYEVSIAMCGGGGGGGGGGGYVDATPPVIQHSCAGGAPGAGGAASLFGNIPVIPNTFYTVTIGANGIGGAPGRNGIVEGIAGTAGGTTAFNGNIIHLQVSGSVGSAAGFTDADGDTSYDVKAAPSGASALAPSSSFGPISIRGSNGGFGGRNNINVSATGIGGNGEILQFTLGGIGGVSAIGAVFAGSGGGGGSSLVGRGGTGGRGANAFSNIASTNAIHPSGSYVGYAGYGGGGGGGGGGASFTNDARNLNGTSGSNGGTGFVQLSWEE